MVNQKFETFVCMFCDKEKQTVDSKGELNKFLHRANMFVHGKDICAECLAKKNKGY
jgi:hypothetical protein